MRLLDPTYIRDICDYSFGDESGMGIGGYMKVANSTNTEFMNKYHQCVNTGKPYMTLFIDNIRLYRRDCIRYTAVEQLKVDWKEIKDAKVQRFSNEDLLALLSTLPNMQFVIFTGFEDTPTDEGIYDKIPDNVIGIWASNAIVHGGKVHPIPYGLQRIVASNDHRQDIILSMMDQDIRPSKLMYINYNTGNHPTRPLLNDKYKDAHWATIHHAGTIYDHVYTNYLKEIKNHKFMLCPSGNAEGCECHRDIECLYMRRVPIVEDTQYHRAIFEQLEAPVLYVNNLMNVTEQLLGENDYLYQQMKHYDMSKLDIEVLYNKIISSI